MLDPLDDVDILRVYALMTGLPATGPRHGGGQNVMLHCPSPGHDDSTRSCSVNPAKGMFKCFGCDAKGGILDFVLTGMPQLRSAKEAADWLRGQGLLVDRGGQRTPRARRAEPAGDVSPKAPSMPKQQIERGRKIGTRVIATYPYVDEDGVLRYRMVRSEWRWELTGETGKEFIAERPDGKGGWIAGMGEAGRIPYRLPELRTACERGHAVYVVEGEKKVDALWQHLSVRATTNNGGANGKFPQEWARYFKGARAVIVLPDADIPGRKGAQERAAMLARAGIQAIYVDLYPGRSDGSDIADWLEERAGRDRLEILREFERSALDYLRRGREWAAEVGQQTLSR